MRHPSRWEHHQPPALATKFVVADEPGPLVAPRGSPQSGPSYPNVRVSVWPAYCPLMGLTPPPPPQVPADLGLKPNPDLRRKRPVEPTEEGELSPSKGAKQARQTQDHRGRRSHSVDSREEQPVAQVRRPPRTWSPVLEVDGVPIAMDASLRHFRGGHAGRMADALQQPLLLPQDMAAYRSFNHPNLFLSLKRDLAMVSNSIHSSFIFVYLHIIFFKSKPLHCV